MTQHALFLCIVTALAVCAVASRTGPTTSDVPLRKLAAVQAGIYWAAKSCDFVQDDYVECDGDTPTVACCDTKTCYKDHTSGNTITCDKKPYNDYPNVGCCPKPNNVDKSNTPQSPKTTNTAKTQNTQPSNTLVTRSIIPTLASGSTSWNVGRH